MIAKKIGNAILAILVVISIGIIGYYLYYLVNNKDFSLGVNYIGDQTGLNLVESDELTSEQRGQYDDRTLFVANYYSNDNENGYSVFEFMINYFTDYTLTSDKYRSSGIQLAGGWLSDVDLDMRRTFRTYYDLTNGIAYSGHSNTVRDSVATKMDREEHFVIKIDERAFAIQMTGESGEFWFLNKKYTFNDLIGKILRAIKSNSKGYGDYYITLDVSRYFTIYEYDDTGKFRADDVTNIIKNYALLKFHYDKNGMTKAEQSLFGGVNCNSNWSYNPVIDTSYWQERVVYNLTVEDLSFRDSPSNGGYYASLTGESKAIINNMPRVKLLITIDLNSNYLKAHKINLIGLDLNAFEGVEINTLTILGSGNFELLSRSLCVTNLLTLQHSYTVTLIASDDFIDSEYTEVVV